MSCLVDRGTTADPVVSAHLVILQHLVARDQPIDAVMAAQLEYLADFLERMPDP